MTGNHNYHDDSHQEQQQAELAYRPHGTSYDEDDEDLGEAIFNPLINAPPRPPLQSYQHDFFPAPTTPTSTPSHDGSNTAGSNSNYYYYSSRPPGNDSSSGMMIVVHQELDLRQRQRRQQQQKWRAMLVLGCLFLFLSWTSRRKHGTHKVSLAEIDFDNSDQDYPSSNDSPFRENDDALPLPFGSVTTTTSPGS